MMLEKKYGDTLSSTEIAGETVIAGNLSTDRATMRKDEFDLLFGVAPEE